MLLAKKLDRDLSQSGVHNYYGRNSSVTSTASSVRDGGINPPALEHL